MRETPAGELTPANQRRLEVVQSMDLIRRIQDRGISIFLIEQNVQQTLEHSARAYVLENGRVMLEGESQALLEEDEIQKACLGL